MAQTRPLIDFLKRESENLPPGQRYGTSLMKVIRPWGSGEFRDLLQATDEHQFGQ